MSNVSSIAPVWTTCPNQLALVSLSQIQAPHARKSDQGQDGAVRRKPLLFLPSSFLGCSDNEIICCFFPQRNGERTFCTRPWKLFPLSASKEPGSDNQKKTTPQPACSWQTKTAHLTPSRRAQEGIFQPQNDCRIRH